MRSNKCNNFLFWIAVRLFIWLIHFSPKMHVNVSKNNTNYWNGVSHFHFGITLARIWPCRVEHWRSHQPLTLPIYNMANGAIKLNFPLAVQNKIHLSIEIVLFLITFSNFLITFSNFHLRYMTLLILKLTMICQLCVAISSISIERSISSRNQQTEIICRKVSKNQIQKLEYKSAVMLYMKFKLNLQCYRSTEKLLSHQLSKSKPNHISTT